MKWRNYLSKLSPLMKEELNKRQNVCVCVYGGVHMWVFNDACIVELFSELDYKFFADSILIFYTHPVECIPVCIPSTVCFQSLFMDFMVICSAGLKDFSLGIIIFYRTLSNTIGALTPGQQHLHVRKWTPAARHVIAAAHLLRAEVRAGVRVSG